MVQILAGHLLGSQEENWSLSDDSPPGDASAMEEPELNCSKDAGSSEGSPLNASISDEEKSKIIGLHRGNFKIKTKKKLLSNFRFRRS